jgi:tetratricopeptide (TPR) repeat protein
MPTFSQFRQTPPFKNWQDAEAFFRDFFKARWKDPNTQRNGRSGQPQHGVDIFGQPDCGTDLAGVQVKGKDDFAKQQVTDKELRAEVEKAKSFEPKLSQFILATTAARDEGIQETARTITAEHQKQGLFTVQIVSWDDTIEELPQYPAVIAVHFPEFASVQAMEAVKAVQDETLLVSQSTLAEVREVKTLITSQSSTPQPMSDSGGGSSILLSVILGPQHDEALDYARDLIRQFRPAEAVRYLEAQRNKLWSKASPHIKARILSLLGAANLALYDERHAAEFFVSGHQHAPDEEPIACNAALGHLLLGENSKAATIAQSVLDKNSTNGQARSILIQISDQLLDEVIAAVPTFAHSDPQVAFAIATLCRRNNDLQQAEVWYRAALSNDKDGDPELKAAVGQVVLEQVWANKVAPTAVGTPNEVDRTKLIEVDDLLSKAWEKLPDEAAVRRSRIGWLVNRGVARNLLGRLEDAAKDLDAAVQLDPEQRLAVFHYGFVCEALKQYEKALAVLSPIKNDTHFPSASLLFGQVLVRLLRYEEAIAHFNWVVDNVPTAHIKQSAKLMIVEALIQYNDFPKAKEQCDALLQEEPNAVDALAAASHIESRLGNKDVAFARLSHAHQCVDGNTPASHLATLADAAYRQQHFDIAAQMYERLADPRQESAFTRSLVLSYLRSGNFKRALELCGTLRTSHGISRFVCEIESVIQEERGDLLATKKAFTELLQLTPDDGEARIQLACVNLRLRDFAAVDTFLAAPPSWKSLSTRFAIQLASLLSIRGKYQDAVAMLYEVRRLHADGEVHLKYLQLFLFHGNQSTDWLVCSTADVGAAVCIENASGERTWFVLEDRADARIADGEITATHPMFSALVGKRVGDQIVISEGSVSTETGKIVEVQSKYVRAFHESAQSMQTLYPEVKGFEIVRLPSDADGSEGAKLFLSHISKRSEHYDNILRAYQSHPLPVAGLASILGGNVFDAWAALCRRAPLGVRVSLGTLEEREEAEAAFADPAVYVVDPIALMTITQLGIGDIIAKCLPILGIVQATLDVLQNEIIVSQTVHGRESMTVWKEGNTFVRREITKEDVDAHLRSIESIVEWANTHCKIIPLPLEVEGDLEWKTRLKKVLDDATVDTLRTTRASGYVLYSDDQRVRSMAKYEFGTKGVWTQMVLARALAQQAITQDEFNSAVIKMAVAGYRYTFFDAHVLLAAARAAEWQVERPFTQVLETLGSQDCDVNLAAGLAANFLFDFWDPSIVRGETDSFVMALLDALTKGWRIRTFIQRLGVAIEVKFFVVPIEKDRVLGLLARWASTRIM